ncbi:MAG TPA: CcmD family protein [Flavisolibacter sp.]|jgi:CcmD family protein|nr:CcmD family protein [Flavisolibacter sp.]
MIKRILLSCFLLICNYILFAQSMANEMRSNGKIYVVVAVLVTIFIGIIIYLIRLDRKLTRLEKETKINH